MARIGRTGWKLAWLALAGAALSLIPVSALAQTCTLPGTPYQVNGYVVGVLSETMESAPAHAAPGGTGPLAAGTYPRGKGVRLAQATETGQLGAGCGTLESLVGDVSVQAQSRILVRLGDDGDAVVNPISGTPELATGSIKGTFHVNTASGSIAGKLEGVLDFALTNHDATDCNGGPCPVVRAEGTWALQGTTSKGAFVGVALVPFQLPGIPGWFYLDVTGVLTTQNPPVVPLGEADYDRFGAPQSKFVITLYQ